MIASMLEISDLNIPSIVITSELPTTVDLASLHLTALAIRKEHIRKMWSSYVLKDTRGRCWECDGCMECQNARECDHDDWDEDEDLKRDYEDYLDNY